MSLRPDKPCPLTRSLAKTESVRQPGKFSKFGPPHVPWLRPRDRPPHTCTLQDPIAALPTHLKLQLPPFAGALDDLYSFDPGSRIWTLLAATSGQRPTPRFFHGFTSAGGALYVHGGRSTGLSYTHAPKVPPPTVSSSYF